MTTTSDIDRWVRQACAMEVLSPKPGNVYPGREFEAGSVRDFLRSADVIAPILATSNERSIGETILMAVTETRNAIGHNTNLGIILLLTPLATALLCDGIYPVPLGRILRETTIRDSELVYQAIQLAEPGGLGEAPEQDLSEVPTLPLIECMRLAERRDLVAAQYANAFADTFQTALPILRSNLGKPRFPKSGSPRAITSTSVVHLAVSLLAEFGDSLIARKCGQEMSDTVRQKAAILIKSDWPRMTDAAARLEEFDAFLRADGNRRNPGTTADLVAATIFAGLATNQIFPDENWNLDEAST